MQILWSKTVKFSNLSLISDQTISEEEAHLAKLQIPLQAFLRQANDLAFDPGHLFPWQQAEHGVTGGHRDTVQSVVEDGTRCLRLRHSGTR